MNVAFRRIGVGIVATPLLTVLVSCASSVRTEADLRAVVAALVDPGQTTAKASAALTAAGFRCAPTQWRSGVVLCARSVQDTLACRQFQGVVLPASSAAVGVPEISLDYGCL
jgi:hypothetical protein